MDQPIMALSDIDLSPGFVTQLSVTPILRETTEQARWRFNPEDRGCYFDGELDFKYLPNTLYRWDPILILKKSRFDDKKKLLWLIFNAASDSLLHYLAASANFSERKKKLL